VRDGTLRQVAWLERVAGRLRRYAGLRARRSA
jgi:hypothetical protein